MDESTKMLIENASENISDPPMQEHLEHREHGSLFFDVKKNNFPAAVDFEKQLSGDVENISLEEIFPNNIPDVPNVPIFDLSEAVDAEAEVMQSAVAEIEKVLEVCKDQPGALFSPAFTDAVKIIRQKPELWADYRVKIKRAKPAGVLQSTIDDATRPEGDFDDGGDGVASALIKLVVDSGELFFDDQADSSFVSVIIDGVTHTLLIGSKNFIEWLSFTYYRDTSTGKTAGTSASESAIKQACFALSGIAKYDGQKQRVFLRVADHNSGHYLFIGDDRLLVIEVLPTGWRVTDESPVKFWRSSSMQALPMPQPGGDLSQLWGFVNIPENGRLLVLAWLLECFRSETPFPILALSGP